MDPELTNFIEVLIALIAAGIALLQHRRATAATAETLQARQATEQVPSHFDPTDDSVTSAPPGVPGRSVQNDRQHEAMANLRPFTGRTGKPAQAGGGGRRGKARYVHDHGPVGLV